MLKKLFMLTAAAVISVSAHAATFKEGQDYQVLKSAKTAKPTVTEFFSYYCPYCFTSQPLMSQVKQKIPAGTAFIENHTSIMGGKMGVVLNKAHATAELLNVKSKISAAIFNHIQVQKKPLTDEAQVRQIFIDQGVSAEEFDGAYNSFAVNAGANRYDKTFEQSGLRGVPAVVVNGKYHLTPQNLKNEAEYFELVNYLLTK